MPANETEIVPDLEMGVYESQNAEGTPLFPIPFGFLHTVRGVGGIKAILGAGYHGLKLSWGDRCMSRRKGRQATKDQAGGTKRIRKQKKKRRKC
jgi:hypothetical protein